MGYSTVSELARNRPNPNTFQISEKVLSCTAAVLNAVVLNPAGLVLSEAVLESGHPGVVLSWAGRQHRRKTSTGLRPEHQRETLEHRHQDD